MKIKKGIQIVTFITILVSLVAGLLVFSLIGDIERGDEDIIVSTAIQSGVFELNLLTYDYVIFPEERVIVQWQAKYNSLKNLITGKNFEDIDQQKILEQVKKDFDNLDIILINLIKIDEKNAMAGKVSVEDNELKNLLKNRLIISTLNIESGANRLTQISIEREKSSINLIYSLCYVLIAVIVSIFSINLFLFSRYIIDPITRLSNDTTIIGSGNLDHKAGMKLDNEIGDLSRSFDSMVGNLKEITTSRDEISREIAKRKKAEEEFRLAFEQSGIGMGLVSPDGHWLKVNPELCNITGYTEKEMLESDFQAITYPSDLELDLKYVENMLKGSIIKYQRKKRYIRKDKGIIWVKVTVSLVRDQAGKPLYFISQIEDITKSEEAEEIIRKMNLELEGKVKERTIDIENSRVSLVNLLDDVNEKSEELKRTTAELMVSKERAEAADRLKSAFLATMSHELRTPLNSILGFTGILLQGFSGPLNDEQNKQLNMVNNSAKHLLSLIKDILDVSKIESGQLKMNIARFKMDKAIEIAVQSVKPLADEKGLSLHVEVETRAVEIESDQRRVEQVIINLLGNAIKFTEKGEVKIECHVSDGKVITRIIDTGIGIKPEHMDRLFKPFVQIDDKLSRRYEGTGLGLSICKSLVEMLGGEIFVKSEEGKGSVFTFTLPIIKETT
jgi:PAS domain S-box-containing protein